MTSLTASALEYRLRKQLYAYLAGDAPVLPRCPCGSVTFIGERYTRYKCSELTPLWGGKVGDERYGGTADLSPCTGPASPGSRYCAQHRKLHPDEPPLVTDDFGHCLRCARSLVPPWHCPASSVDCS